MLGLNPSRRARHRDLEQFMALLDDIIEQRRKTIRAQKFNNVKESDRDLLTLMIENAGEGGLTNEELKVNGITLLSMRVTLHTL